MGSSGKHDSFLSYRILASFDVFIKDSFQSFLGDIGLYRVLLEEKWLKWFIVGTGSSLRHEFTQCLVRSGSCTYSLCSSTLGLHRYGYPFRGSVFTFPHLVVHVG